MMDKTSYPPFLPGAMKTSDITHIYHRLLNGETITSLDSVRKSHTVCLTKYISILRNKYDIPVVGRWVKVSKRKRVKLYSLPR